MRRKKQWDSTLTDLKRYKPSKRELKLRKKAAQSKHNIFNLYRQTGKKKKRRRGKKNRQEENYESPPKNLPNSVKKRKQRKYSIEENQIENEEKQPENNHQSLIVEEEEELQRLQDEFNQIQSQLDQLDVEKSSYDNFTVVDDQNEPKKDAIVTGNENQPLRGSPSRNEYHPPKEILDWKMEIKKRLFREKTKQEMDDLKSHVQLLMQFRYRVNEHLMKDGNYQTQERERKSNLPPKPRLNFNTNTQMIGRRNNFLDLAEVETDADPEPQLFNNLISPHPQPIHFPPKRSYASKMNKDVFFVGKRFKKV